MKRVRTSVLFELYVAGQFGLPDDGSPEAGRSGHGQGHDARPDSRRVDVHGLVRHRSGVLLADNTSGRLYEVRR